MPTLEDPSGLPSAPCRGGLFARRGARTVLAALILLISGTAGAWQDDKCKDFRADQDLSFGVVAGGTATQGSVTIHPATGNVTTSGGVTFFGGDAHPAVFSGRAHGTAQHCTVTLALPGSVTLRGRGRTLTLNQFTLHPASIKLSKRRQFSFNVGATLSVPAGLPPGIYWGSITATVIFTDC